MRKAIIIVPLFLILLLVLHLFTSRISDKTTPESFLSQDVLVVVKQYDLEKRLEQFQASPLGNVLAEIDYPGIARELGIPELDIEKIVSVEKEIKRAASDPLLKMLFGREVTIALFPFGEQATDILEQKPIDNIIVIARPKHYAKLVDLAASLMAEKAQITESHYGGYVIRRIPVDKKQTINAVRVKDHLLFSYNERLLRRSLDIYDNASSRLNDLAEYNDTMKHFADSSLISYLNLMALRNNSSSIDESSDPGRMEVIFSNFSNLEGYQKMYIGIGKGKNKIIGKAIINFDRNGIKTEHRELFDIEPIVTDSHGRVGFDTIWYYWTNRVCLQTLLNLYEQEKRPKNNSAKNGIMSELAAVTGSSAAELVSLIDNDIFIVLKDIPVNQFVPVPRFMIGLKITDSEKMKSAMGKILNHYDIPINTRTVKNIKINSWGGIIGYDDVQPTFAFIEQYLLIASNREQIKDFISLPGKKKSLGESDQFKNSGNGITDKNNSLGYLQFAKVTNMIKEIVSWGGTMIAIKDREAARKSKILIDRLINPILDGMAMYSTIGTRSYVEDEKIIIESTIIIEDI